MFQLTIMSRHGAIVLSTSFVSEFDLAQCLCSLLIGSTFYSDYFIQVYSPFCRDVLEFLPEEHYSSKAIFTRISIFCSSEGDNEL